jgi:hypothetical protein
MWRGLCDSQNPSLGNNGQICLRSWMFCHMNCQFTPFLYPGQEEQWLPQGLLAIILPVCSLGKVELELGLLDGLGLRAKDCLCLMSQKRLTPSNYHPDPFHHLSFGGQANIAWPRPPAASLTVFSLLFMSYFSLV